MQIFRFGIHLRESAGTSFVRRILTLPLSPASMVRRYTIQQNISLLPHKKNPGFVANGSSSVYDEDPVITLPSSDVILTFTILAFYNENPSQVNPNIIPSHICLSPQCNHNNPMIRIPQPPSMDAVADIIKANFPKMFADMFYISEGKMMQL